MNQKERVQKALEQCFGQVHSTPVGKMCLLGRIDRAYALAAANPEDTRYKAAITTLERQFHDAINAYRQALAGYDGDEILVTQCKCEYCRREPTLCGVQCKVGQYLVNGA